MKSRTSFTILSMECPLNWVSKLQYQIDLNTMETEYILLYQSMHEHIDIIEVLKYIQTFVISDKIGLQYIAPLQIICPQ